MDHELDRRRIRRGIRNLIGTTAIATLVALGTASCIASPQPDAASTSPTAPEATSEVPADPEQAAELAELVQDAMDDLHLKAVIVKVQVGDELVIEQAFGESMTGVPATTDMHFRNGAVAFAYVSNLLLQYVDDGTVTLDDTVDEWMPDLPESDVVTLRMLTNQTTGYPDFETDEGWTAAYNADPFHLFTFDERLDAAFSRPMQFEPGTNWSYSHTNFMILGEILSQIGGAPLDELIQERVLDPMGLEQTAAYDSSYIPEPVLHSFSSERRVALQVPPGQTFYEESSFWNPVWGTPMGAAQTTTVDDLVTTAIAIGTGELLSEESFHEMTDSKLIGFGEHLPVCGGSCFTQVDAYNYGLGIVRSGDWILQNPLLSGYSAVEAYLPSDRVAIGVAATFAPEAFDDDGIYDNAADNLFRLIGAYVAPDSPPPTKG